MSIRTLTLVPTQALPSPGDVIHGYRVLRELGRGSLSVVYLASRGNTDGRTRRCALKLVWPHLARNFAAQGMLYDEAAVVSRIRHPNVAGLVARGYWGDVPYIGIELVDGRTYHQVIAEAKRRGRKLPIGFHLAILARAAAGLHAAHQTVDSDGIPCGIVHRDFKPHNLLVGHDGAVKVIDFSIAAARARHTTSSCGQIKGSLNYMAPEQVVGPDTDFRADVWALGVVAWEALSGRRLFKSKAYSETVKRVLAGSIPNLSEYVQDVPPRVAAMIRACLERDRNLRPRSCNEIAELFAEEARAGGFASETDIADYFGELCEASQTVAMSDLDSEVSSQRIFSPAQPEIDALLESYPATVPPPSAIAKEVQARFERDQHAACKPGAPTLRPCSPLPGTRPQAALLPKELPKETQGRSWLTTALLAFFLTTLVLAAVLLATEGLNIQSLGALSDSLAVLAAD